MGVGPSGSWGLCRAIGVMGLGHRGHGAGAGLPRGDLDGGVTLDSDWPETSPAERMLFDIETTYNDQLARVRHFGGLSWLLRDSTATILT